MSGICGIIGESANPNDAKIMLNMIRHRGPDKKGIFSDKDVCIASCKQKLGKKCDKPFGFNENNSIVVAFDGLIYNDSELTHRLKERSHNIRSDADAEIIAHLYEEYGERCANKIEGEFSFALWDSDKKRLVLCADKFGTKPLLFSFFNGNLLFSSETKSILVFPGFKRNVNIDAIYNNYILLGVIPNGARPFKNVHSLTRGRFLMFEKGDIKIGKYWELDNEHELPKNDEIVDKCLTLLKKSVRLRIEKNSEAGCTFSLSGGLDSSALAAISSEYAENIETYSAGIEEDDEELKYAGLVADHIGSKHHEMLLDMEKSIDVFPIAVWNSELMSSTPANIFRRMLYDNIKKRKLFSGLGAEETFMDKRYLAAEIIKNTSKIVPYSIRKQISSFNKFKFPHEIEVIIEGLNSKNVAEACARIGSFAQENKRKWIFKTPININFNDARSENKKIIREEFMNCLSQRYLWGTDGQAMMNAQQLVNPFLDSNLVNFTASIPRRAYIFNEGKIILKKCMKDILPKEVLLRKKKFGSNIIGRFIRNMNTLHADVMNDYISRLSSRPEFNKIQTTKLTPKERLDLFSLELWYEIFIDPDKINDRIPRKILTH